MSDQSASGYTAKNHIAGFNHSSTAENVCRVLGFLAAMNPPDGLCLSDGDEIGRKLILLNCIEALETICGPMDEDEGNAEDEGTT